MWLWWLSCAWCHPGGFANPGRARSRRRNAGFDSSRHSRLPPRSRVSHNSNVFQCTLYALLLQYYFQYTCYRKVNSPQGAVTMFFLSCSSLGAGHATAARCAVGPHVTTKGNHGTTRTYSSHTKRHTTALQSVPATALSSSFSIGGVQVAHSPSARRYKRRLLLEEFVLKTSISSSALSLQSACATPKAFRLSFVSATFGTAREHP